MGGAHDRRPEAGGAGALPRAVRAAERDLTLDDLVYINRMTTVGQVLPNVAHELNNALQIVGGLVEMIGARADLPRDVLDKIARIGAQSSRATVMIRDLVAFSRRDEGGVRLVDLGRIVEGALAMRRYHLSRARIAVTTEAAAGAAFALADAHALHQVLLNLLINAEHSMAGRQGGTLAVVVSADPDAVTVTVEDNGPGVPPDLRRRVAEPFFTTKGHAAGLGLTVAAALMERDGGALSLDHLPDGGTRAVMRLPARPRPG